MIRHRLPGQVAIAHANCVENRAVSSLRLRAAIRSGPRTQAPRELEKWSQLLEERQEQVVAGGLEQRVVEGYIVLREHVRVRPGRIHMVEMPTHLLDVLFCGATGGHCRSLHLN